MNTADIVILAIFIASTYALAAHNVGLSERNEKYPLLPYYEPRAEQHDLIAMADGLSAKHGKGSIPMGITKRSARPLSARRLWLLKLLRSRMAIKMNPPRYSPSKRQRLSINGALSSLADMLEAEGRHRYNNEMSHTHQRLMQLGKRGYESRGRKIDGLDDDVMADIVPEQQRWSSDDVMANKVPEQQRWPSDDVTYSMADDSINDVDSLGRDAHKRGARLSINGPLSSLVDMLDHREKDMIANRLMRLGRR